jgi:hypothetical protein
MQIQPAVRPAVATDVMGTIQAEHPDFSAGDLTATVDLATRGDSQPLTIEQARAGAAALVQVRALPLDPSAGITDTIELYTSGGPATMSPALVTGTTDVLWTDGGRSDIYRISPELSAIYGFSKRGTA